MFNAILRGAIAPKKSFFIDNIDFLRISLNLSMSLNVWFVYCTYKNAHTQNIHLFVVRTDKYPSVGFVRDLSRMIYDLIEQYANRMEICMTVT